jgi:hypothetical protein
VLEIVQSHEPSVVGIATLPPGGLAHTRHLCKRLHSRFPSQKILICRWGESPLDKREAWTACGADYIGLTFAETIKQLDELAQFLRPADGPSAGTKPGPGALPTRAPPGAGLLPAS